MMQNTRSKIPPLTLLSPPGSPLLLAGAGAVGMAYAATTDGKQGDAARSAGATANELLAKGKEANQKHKITDKAAAAASGWLQ